MFIIIYYFDFEQIFYQYPKSEIIVASCLFVLNIKIFSFEESRIIVRQNFNKFCQTYCLMTFWWFGSPSLLKGTSMVPFWRVEKFKTHHGKFSVARYSSLPRVTKYSITSEGVLLLLPTIMIISDSPFKEFGKINWDKLIH